jgi:hypothetical protein
VWCHGRDTIIGDRANHHLDSHWPEPTGVQQAASAPRADVTNTYQPPYRIGERLADLGVAGDDLQPA